MRCAVLAEPHHQLSDRVRSLLEPVFEVIVMVAEEASLTEALARMGAAVAVVDLSLRPGDGLAMIRRLHARFPGVTLIAIGAQEAPGVSRAVAAAGAHAFVAKGVLASELVPAVERAIARHADEKM
ncbi:MAG TPA: response regulator [Amaricoccus sp.]|nr:response regulator [Amaricoccus sp.]